jgi:hypothetical protein
MRGAQRKCEACGQRGASDQGIAAAEFQVWNSRIWHRSSPWILYKCSRPHLPNLTKKAANELRNFIRMRFKREVARIKKMNLRVGKITLIGFRAGWDEG